MSILSAIGLGNDPSLKEIRKLNSNFQLLLKNTNSHHKQKEKFIEKQDNLIRRLMQKTSKQYDESPIVGNNGAGILKEIKEDDNHLLALLLGGGLIAGALMMGHSILNSLGGFFDDVQEKVIDEMGLEDATGDGESPTASQPSNVSPSTSATESPPSSSGGAATTAWAPVLDMIAHGEAHKGSYDSIYPSSIKPGLSKMTIAQADAWQARTASSRGSAAAGRYQFMWIKDQARAAGIGPNELFSPANQDKMAVALIEKKRGVSLSLARSNPDKALSMLAPEWAGLPKDSGGLSYHHGDGRNKATISYKHAISAFKKLQTGGMLGNLKGAVKNVLGMTNRGKTDKAGQVPDFSKSPLKGNYLTTYQEIKRHFPEAQAHHIAAAMGNFDTEAPGLKPNTYQGSKGKPIPGKPGRGLAQWEVPHKGNPTGRWAVAEKMYGKDVFTNLKKQLEFFAWEMKTGAPISEGPHKGDPNLPRGRNAKGMWLKAPDLKSATEGFMVGYEAPGTPHWDKRLKGAQRIHQQILQHQKMFPGHKTGGFVMPKAKTPKINIKQEPRARLQRGGNTSADRLKDLHNDAYVGSIQKRRHSRSVIVVKTETRLIPTLQPQEWDRSIHGSSGSTYNPATVAKTMYRVQKGAFT